MCCGFFPLFNSDPTWSSPIIVKIFLLWVYMYWDLWSTHANFLPNRQRAWSASTACLFSQDLLKGAHGRLVCHNVAWLHLAWVGVRGITPPPPTRLCTYARHSDYGGWRGEAIAWQYILYVGDGRVQRFDFTWWKGALASPPTIDWVMHACYHMPT